MQPAPLSPILTTPSTPDALSAGYIFDKLFYFLKSIFLILSNPHTWDTLAVICSVLSVIFIALIVYSLVRMREIQNHEKEEIDHLIHQALARDAATERDENPRWKYILTLIENPNESDWRVAIIEADTMLDELLEERGIAGATLADRLKAAEGSFTTLRNAWDAHNVRNMIAHAGSEYSLTQVETRRVIKMFQNVFEELKAI